MRYDCLVSGNITGKRPCGSQEPVGTVVQPECNSPNYYSTDSRLMRCTESGWDYTAHCYPGLPKKGYNITIIIKDVITVSVGSFLYSSNWNSSDNSLSNMTVHDNTETGNKDVNTPLASTTVNPLDYEISEDDWRMGPIGPPRTQSVAPADNKNNDGGVNVHIYNSSVTVNTNDKIHFPN